MSRTFVDPDLLMWEAYASTGDFGLPLHPRIIFHCLSAPELRARFVVHGHDEADTAEAVSEMPDERLLELLRHSEELR